MLGWDTSSSQDTEEVHVHVSIASYHAGCPVMNYSGILSRGRVAINSPSHIMPRIQVQLYMYCDGLASHPGGVVVLLEDKLQSCGLLRLVL